MLRTAARVLVLLGIAACGDQVPTGPIVYCWDLDQNEACTMPDEDLDGNGVCDVSDCRGAVGPAGAQGAIGPTGEQGPQGDPGAVGPEGAIGPAGPEGAAGPEGPIGPQGVPGDVGPMGPIGPQGPQGFAGDVGPVGPQGAQGDVGPTGPQGVEGAVGPQGPIGPVGAQGIAGLACWDLDGDGACNPLVEDFNGDLACGVADCIGPEGPIGATGAMGPQGERGLVGPQGPIGATGAQGPEGPIGPQGPIGATGPQGPTGPTGATGAQGPTGATGPQGPAGATGPQGGPGPTGATGATGATGPQGPQGEAGPQGPPGADGSPDTPSQVLAKLLQVDGTGSGIDADRLDGVDWPTIQARLDAIDALLAPVELLGATAFVSGGVVNYGGKVGVAAVKQVCVDEFGPGARPCSYADVVDAIADANVPPGFNTSVWATRDLVFDTDLGGLAGCRAMTLANSYGLAFTINATHVESSYQWCDVANGGAVLPFACCTGH